MNSNHKHSVTAILHGISIVAILFILGLFLYCLNSLGKLAQMKNARSENQPAPVVLQELHEPDSLQNPDTPSKSDSAVQINTAESVSTESDDFAESEDSSLSSSLSPFLNDDYITYREGFFCSTLSNLTKDRITGFSYHENEYITFEDLRYLSIQYYDFDGNIQTGELICNKAIAEDLLDIFSQLFDVQYPLEKIRLVDDYGADDDLSCADNNTSCFNFRVVAGSTNLSKHAYGLAIDVNPFYNPYVTYPDGVEHISPEGSEPYADRTNENEHLIHKGDLIYQLFIDHGFSWGGNWKSLKDYQHFQKEI